MLRKPLFELGDGFWERWRRIYRALPRSETVAGRAHCWETYLRDAGQLGAEGRERRSPCWLDVGVEGVHMMKASSPGWRVVFDPLEQNDWELLYARQPTNFDGVEQRSVCRDCLGLATYDDLVWKVKLLCPSAAGRLDVEAQKTPIWLMTRCDLRSVHAARLHF